MTNEAFYHLYTQGATLHGLDRVCPGCRAQGHRLRAREGEDQIGWRSEQSHERITGSGGNTGGEGGLQGQRYLKEADTGAQEKEVELERQDPEAEGWAESGGSAQGAQPGSPVADRQQEPGPRCRAAGCRRLARAPAMLTAVQPVTHKTPVRHTQTRAGPCVTAQPSALRVEAAEAEPPFKLGTTLSALGSLGEQAPGANPSSQRRGPGGILLGSLDPPSAPGMEQADATCSHLDPLLAVWTLRLTPAVNRGKEPAPTAMGAP